jgi:hypothetical protein
MVIALNDVCFREVKRTLQIRTVVFAFEPKRTLGIAAPGHLQASGLRTYNPAKKDMAHPHGQG